MPHDFYERLGDDRVVVALDGQLPDAVAQPSKLSAEGQPVHADHGQPCIANGGEPQGVEAGQPLVAEDGQNVVVDLAPTLNKIRFHHRRRRFAMKVQQKLNRSLESFVRREATDWHPSLGEKERKRESAKALSLIAKARKGETDESEIALIASAVDLTDRAREHADVERKSHERDMENTAKLLLIWPWCKAIRGLGPLGLATILAEAGDLSDYATHSRLWSRLGFAPYEGLAGSSWKRESWRSRSLTKDEWMEHPFSGERYALIHQIAVWLRNAQCEGKEKSGTLYGKPKGEYGSAYVQRREHTAVTHPDWTGRHAHMDALRYMMKRLLRDLWRAWRRASTWVPETQASEAMPVASFLMRGPEYVARR